MNKIGKALLQGLVAVLPIGLTIYLLYWLITTLESSFRFILTTVIPESYYLPGLGLFSGLLVLFLVGLAVDALIVQRLIHTSENLLERIPFVKSIYGALRDFMDHFSPKKTNDEMEKVVLVRFNNLQLVGFITGNIEKLLSPSSDEEKMAVYLPMSYQLGGYTVYVSSSDIEPIDMSVEDAMRHVLTAGLSTNK